MTTTTESTRTINWPLLGDLLRWAAQEQLDLEEFYKAKGWPRHNQGHWVTAMQSSRVSMCSTTACVAGNAVIQSDDWVPVPLAGNVIGLPDLIKNAIVHERSSWETSAVPVKVIGTDAFDRPVHSFDETRAVSGPHSEYISTLAEQILGLEHRQGSALFDGENTVEDLVHLGYLFAEQAGVDPTEVLPAELEDLAYSSDWTVDRDGYFERGTTDNDEPYDPAYDDR